MNSKTTETPCGGGIELNILGEKMTQKDNPSEPLSKRHPWQRHYNGWSWKERCAINPIQNRAIRDGSLIKPTICSICGFSKPDDLKGAGYIFMHTERYDRPLDINPCCKSCHAALHARFDDPMRWHSIVKRNWRQGAWFIQLSLDPASQTQAFEITYPNKV